MGKRTALYDMHVKYGGDVVDYAGWELSTKFEGLVAEHNTVRNSVGMFDVSHMGEVEIKGPDAIKFTQYLMTNDLTSIGDGQIIYTFFCNENGGVVDDLLVYKYNNEHVLLVVNAGNTDKDVAWIEKHAAGFDVVVKNLSDDIAEVAVQGPFAQKVLQKISNINLDEIKFFHFIDGVEIAGVKTIVSRTGYTGEDGFEVYMSNEDAVTVWEAVMEAGKDEELKPVGLGCRDTLRFEANLPLYGNELGDDITPLEAGFGFFVKLDVDGDFIGKDALKKQKAEGLKRKVVGFEMIGKGIPRHGYPVVADGKEIGFVTTGYAAPTVGKTIGLAMVDIAYADLDSKIEIQIRNKTSEAKVISRKFLDRRNKSK